MSYDGLDPNCVCSLDDYEVIVAFNNDCPIHGSLAPPRIIQRWCSGSTEPVIRIQGRYGTCRYCGQSVAQKRGHASVHLSDGSTPRA